MTNPELRERLAVAALAAGAAMIIVALLADPVLGGARGFGVFQWVLAATGAGLAVASVAVSPALRERVRSAAAERPDDVVLSAAEIALLALAFASFTALLEGAVLAVAALMGTMLRLGEHVVWMAAITNTLVLLAVGLVLLAAGAAWTRARSARVVTFVFGLLAVDAIIHRLPGAERADDAAKWLLAAGVGSVIARAAHAALLRGRGRVPRVALAGALVIAVAGLLAAAHVPIRERIARAALGPARGGPNILLIILDTVRAKSLGLYGYARATTPNLERFARSGVVFNRAIAPSSWTLPSHATLFSGVYPTALTADWRAPFDDTHPVLAEVLAERGYLTAAFSANGSYANANTGLERGFARFEDFPVSASEAIRTASMLRSLTKQLGSGDVLREGYTGRKSATVIRESFLDWLAGAPDDRPFFAFLNFFDAHDPYMPAAPFDTLYGPVRPLPEIRWGTPPSVELTTAWRDDYDRAITFIDHELGALFMELERRGILDETIVIVTADHGEMIGEQEFMRHGTTLHLSTLHVPLLIRYPLRTPGGLRVAEPVTLRDVPATVLELAGVPSAPLPGNSLAPLWTGGAPPNSTIASEVRKGVRIPNRYPSSDADLQSLIAGGAHYIRDSKGREELYRFESDPDERENLVGDPDAARELDTLRELWARHIRTTGAKPASGGGAHD
jgi:arylsulfatase A-like enzyme